MEGGVVRGESVNIIRKMLLAVFLLSMLICAISVVPVRGDIWIYEVRPSAAPVGAWVKVRGRGYLSSYHEVYFDDILVASFTTDRYTGLFTVEFQVPNVTLGVHTITVVYVEHQSEPWARKSAYFRVVEPEIKVEEMEPEKAYVGDTVSLRGTFLVPSATLKIMFDDQIVAETVTGKWGGWSASFTIPRAEAGFHSVRVLWAGHEDVSANTTLVVLKSECTIESWLESQKIVLGAASILRGSIEPEEEGNITIRIWKDGELYAEEQVKVGSDGTFTFRWIPREAGVYEIKAFWFGGKYTQPGESGLHTLTVNPALVKVRIQPEDAAVAVKLDGNSILAEGMGCFNVSRLGLHSLATEEIVEIGEGERLVFERWSLPAGESDSPEVDLNVTGSLTATAVYKKQYYLRVVSEHGSPVGEGWYDEGSTAIVTVKAEEGFLPKYVFAGWSGDVSGNAPSITVEMDGAKTIVASWKEDWSMLLYLIIAGAAALTIFAALKRRSASKN